MNGAKAHDPTEAELQARAIGSTSDLAWQRIGPAVELLPRMHGITHERQWHGTVTWSRLDAGHEHRVVVRQYERIAEDPGKDARAEKTVLPKDRRVMFAAIFDRPRG